MIQLVLSFISGNERDEHTPIDEECHLELRKPQHKSMNYYVKFPLFVSLVFDDKCTSVPLLPVLKLSYNIPITLKHVPPPPFVFFPSFKVNS